jgi:ketosteroid isomerase-like protein
MSQENMEIVRSTYEAVNRRDWDAAFRDQSPDVELTTPRELNRDPTPGPIGGASSVQRFWEELLTACDAASAEPEEFFERGDQVAVVVEKRGPDRTPAASRASLLAEITLSTTCPWRSRRMR